MKRLSTIAWLLFTLVLTMSAQKSPAPSLKETQDWITNTLERGNRGRGYGGFSEHYTDEKYNTESEVHVTFNACEMTVTTHTRGGIVSYSSDMVDTVNLKDLDPHTIKIKPSASKYGGLECYAQNDDCDEASVSVETKNAKLLVHTEMNSNFKDQSLNTGKSTESYEHTEILVSDLPYAKKLSRALTRAIELCGGRPSAF